MKGRREEGEERDEGKCKIPFLPLLPFFLFSLFPFFAA